MFSQHLHCTYASCVPVLWRDLNLGVELSDLIRFDKEKAILRKMYHKQMRYRVPVGMIQRKVLLCSMHFSPPRAVVLGNTPQALEAGGADHANDGALPSG